MPIDTNRLEQFKKTKRVYDRFPQTKEFILPTRNYRAVRDYLNAFGLMKNVKLISYVHDEGFNPSHALNLGVQKAKYPQVIISSPEVMPETSVLEQLQHLIGQNVVCEVWDEDENGELDISLVNRNHRSDTPGMYFLAMFNKADVEAINGWDEEFMKGYAYDDNDFGDRWVRAGLPFTVTEEIRGRHQYHPRSETIPGGSTTNYNRWQANNANGIIRPEKGLAECKLKTSKKN